MNKILKFLLILIITLPSLIAMEGTTTIATADSTGLQMGMNRYLPPGYDDPANATKRYPLWVFLTGAGERGNPNSTDAILNLSTHWGPARETRYGDRDYPCVVVTPISEDYFASLTIQLNAMIEYLKANFRIAADRICVSGLCSGAGGVMEYAQLFPEQIASLLPVITESDPWNPGRLSDIPTWLFHGFGDPSVPRRLTITWANAIANAEMATPDCMANYPFGSDGTANATDQTAIFHPESGWTWLDGVRPPSDSLLHFTIYASDQHEIWQPTINNNAVMHWFFKQRRKSPFAGAPAILPGRIQAEDFDFGGQTRAYSDKTAENTGGNSHRIIANPYDGIGDDEQVDLASGGSGVVLTGTEAGEWCEFTTTCSTSGTYDLKLRVSAPAPGGALHFTANGITITNSIAIPASENFTTLTVPGIALGSGPQLLRLVVDAGGFDLDWFELSFKDSNGGGGGGGNQSSKSSSSCGLGSGFAMLMLAVGLLMLRTVNGQKDPPC